MGPAIVAFIKKNLPNCVVKSVPFEIVEPVREDIIL